MRPKPVSFKPENETIFKLKNESNYESNSKFFTKENKIPC
jgi:hypothetical protein